MSERGKELKALAEMEAHLPEMQWRGCPDHPEPNSNGNCWGIYDPMAPSTSGMLRLLDVGERLVALRNAAPELLADAMDLDEQRWKRLWVDSNEEDGQVEIHADLREANTYLFAIETTGDGWQYFSDAIVWDSETPPEWSDGHHGWSLEDVQWFRVVLPPPSP